MGLHHSLANFQNTPMDRSVVDQLPALLVLACYLTHRTKRCWRWHDDYKATKQHHAHRERRRYISLFPRKLGHPLANVS